MIRSAVWSGRVGSGVRLLFAGLVLSCGSFGLPVAVLSSSGGQPSIADGGSAPSSPGAAVAGRAGSAQNPGAPDSSAQPEQLAAGVGSSNAGSDPSPFATAGTFPPPSSGGLRSFIVLGDSLSAWEFAPGSTTPDTDGAWPAVLAREDPQLVLARNAGIPGNTTAQMLARLGRDVLGYNPDVLFLLGGTNDVGTNVREMDTIANVRLIVDVAKEAGITVVLLTVPPANGQYGDKRQARLALNADYAALAQEEGILLVDAAATLSTPDGCLAGEYSAYDGLHLSGRGAQAVADAVERALHPATPPYG